MKDIIQQLAVVGYTVLKELLKEIGIYLLVENWDM
jgi:hypothetical protein